MRLYFPIFLIFYRLICLMILGGILPLLFKTSIITGLNICIRIAFISSNSRLCRGVRVVGNGNEVGESIIGGTLVTVIGG